VPISLRRGEVWWVQLDPTRGSEIQKTRPCIVLTTDVVNVRRRTVVIVPLSSSPRASPPLLIGVQSVGTPAVAVLDQIRAVTKERFERKLGSISNEELEAIEDGLREVLEL
jgi:mRNA interferase MazF